MLYYHGIHLVEPANQSEILKAILDHLVVLLNTRQGSLTHMPDYGMPPFDLRAQHLIAKNQFIKSLKSLIYTYEPRISYLSVESINHQRADCVLELQLMFTVFDSHLTYAAILQSGGQILLERHHGS